MKTLKDDIKIITRLDLPILPMWMNEKSALERFERDEIAFFLFLYLYYILLYKLWQSCDTISSLKRLI
jgi:hypothetical protein